MKEIKATKKCLILQVQASGFFLPQGRPDHSQTGMEWVVLWGEGEEESDVSFLSPDEHFSQ